MTSTAALLSLPPELLHDIVGHADLPLVDLFSVSMTCRILQEICLTLHLRRGGIIHPEELCSIVVPHGPRRIGDTLSTLYQAMWITKIKRLEFRFDAETLPQLQTITSHLVRITAFIRRLTSVEETAFHLKCLSPPLDAPSYGDVAVWSYRMGQLLNVVVERGCTVLDVNGVHHVIHPADPPRAVGLPKLFQFLKPRARYTRPLPSLITTEPIPSSIHPTSNLTHLTIGSSSLFCQPLLQWTCAVLTSSPISHLTLRDIWLPEPQASTFVKSFRKLSTSVTHLKLRDASLASDDYTVMGQLFGA
ncbi:hypothetical protein NMY22_g16278 [Coprinellus aureogranulatus]|nr:hypothetical protein NMY22_g16278 [Coprinellus aureogranulatus]